MHMRIAIVRQLLAYVQTSRSNCLKGRKHPHVILHGTRSLPHTERLQSCPVSAVHCIRGCRQMRVRGVKGVCTCSQSHACLSCAFFLSLSLLVSQEIQLMYYLASHSSYSSVERELHVPLCRSEVLFQRAYVCVSGGICVHSTVHSE